MYWASVFEDQPVIEAAIYGHAVSLDEVQEFARDFRVLVDGYQGKPFYIVLDYNKAQFASSEALFALDNVKDEALDRGAVKVFSVPQRTAGAYEHMAFRMQYVLEDREEFIPHAANAKFPPLPSHYVSAA